MKPQKKGLGLGSGRAVKTTRAAQAIARQLDNYIAYFRLAKGRDPDLIHLKKGQFEDLGLAAGDAYKGVTLADLPE